VLTWPGLTLFADVVEASRLVADTSARSRKIAILADLLRTLDADEVPIVVGFLSGVPRQGRVGIGYATVYGTQVTPSESPSLQVEDVDRAIAEIEASTGAGSSGRRRELLDGLLSRAAAPEADFLRRLLTGELRQGALAGLMADAVAKAAAVPGELARRALMLSGDLTRMAQVAMTEGEPGLKRIGFEIFRPILPMLASTSANVAEAVSGFERASVEWKLDGIRIQIHRREDQVRIYTRNLNEITETLPGVVAAVRRLPVRQVVLDGEALWMSEEGPGSFQHTVSQIDSDAPPEGIVTFLFDLLHVDGEDLLDAPLHERAARLAAIAPELKIPSALTCDPAEGERVLEASLQSRARGRRGQGRGVGLRRRPARQGLAEGQACTHLRPGRARRRVGTRPPAGLALEPPPGRPRAPHRRVRDGRQVLQGPDR
jgi:DNA ligase 1